MKKLFLVLMFLLVGVVAQAETVISIEVNGVPVEMLPIIVNEETDTVTAIITPQPVAPTEVIVVTPDP